MNGKSRLDYQKIWKSDALLLFKDNQPTIKPILHCLQARKESCI